MTVLGTADEMTAAQAREKALAAIAAAKAERETGPLTSRTSSCADRRGAGNPPPARTTG